MAASRNSDRWVTPGVVIAAILVTGLILVVVAGGVTYLAARGINPDPMIRLVAQIATAAGALGSLVLQLVGRSTVAKVERNTGTLAGVVADAIAPPAPAPAPAPVGVDLVDEYSTTEQQRTPVPPIPAYPRHARSSR